jgi:hypothetical protein
VSPKVWAAWWQTIRYPGAGRSDDQDKSEIQPAEEGARYLASKISQDSGLLNK